MPHNSWTERLTSECCTSGSISMSYFPPEISGPQPSIDDQVFWNYCQQHELRFQRCANCKRFRHPPGPVCSACLSFEVEWILAPEVGTVFSFTIVHHPAHPAVATRLPYNVVVVDFPECDHVRLVSNVIDAAPDDIRIGMIVSLVWETAGNGLPVPRFRRHV
jgi:uncharacterized OB-fold protein